MAEQYGDEGPRWFRDNIVLPNAEAFREKPWDLRLAFNAVAAVDALAAQIIIWAASHCPDRANGIEGDAKYKDLLSQANPDFGIIRDIAKAQKHVVIDRGPQAKRTVSNADQIKTKSLGLGEMLLGEMRLGPYSSVVVLTDAGRHRDVEVLVWRALALLDVEMMRFGVPE